MFEFVIGEMIVVWGAVFSVLNQSISSNRRRNRQISGVLLTLAAIGALTGLIYGLAGCL